MVRIVLALLAMGLGALAPPLSADGYELKPKKIKLTRKTADVFPEAELRPLRALSGVTKEPKYLTNYPQRFAATFGGTDGVRVYFAADERKGSDKGFDLLYADLEGSGDLSKAKRSGGKPFRRSSTYTDTTFRPFKIQIPGQNGSLDYLVQARLTVQRPGLGRGAPKDASLYLVALCAMEGTVEFGGKKQKLIVFDANCNGIFGEMGTPRKSGTEAGGDKVWIGSGSPHLDAAYMEALPLGKYVGYAGDWYELSFPESTRVEIAKADVPLGKLKVSNPGFLLELVQGDDVLYAINPTGDELRIPAGDYEVNTPGFRRRGRGGIWELEGEPGTLKEAFSVAENGATDIALGPPLKVMISVRMRQVGNGLQATFAFSIEGSRGEKYKYLRLNGKKVALPKISIRGPNGAEVKKGRFEYG